MAINWNKPIQFINGQPAKVITTFLLPGGKYNIKVVLNEATGNLSFHSVNGKYHNSGISGDTFVPIKNVPEEEILWQSQYKDGSSWGWMDLRANAPTYKIKNRIAIIKQTCIDGKYSYIRYPALEDGTIQL